MADEKEKGDEKEAAPPAAAGSKKKLFLIIGGVVLLLIAIGVPVTLLMLKGKAANTGTESADANSAHDDNKLVPEGNLEEDELSEGEEPLGALFPLDTFVVNLAGGRFIRVQVQIEFQSRDVPKRFYAKLIPIRDGIISILAARSANDLSNEKGREQLKLAIKELANEAMRKEDAKKIYFTQFIIQ